MKLKYLNAEIETLNLLERNGDLSEYGKDKLEEFEAIKQALALLSVGRSLTEKEKIDYEILQKRKDKDKELEGWAGAIIFCVVILFLFAIAVQGCS